MVTPQAIAEALDHLAVGSMIGAKNRRDARRE